MKAWKEDLKIGDEVLLLSDGNGTFTKAIGTELDLSDKPVGFGVRSRRYALLVDGGVVKVWNLDDGGLLQRRLALCASKRAFLPSSLFANRRSPSSLFADHLRRALQGARFDGERR
ncbi:peroxiredoxin-2E-1, chloroplastic-like [Macadamia integrifolia]|uniref:peroxiredoxin-2E-1, chloroplastic-like n=1 Tax=Macadamia integrifolia TaxID=60698 RepID=UPI001C52E798|nr:peroxiredoxin-2E-1, chloroplastic-like [Macadamia integrifolia]